MSRHCNSSCARNDLVYYPSKEDQAPTRAYNIALTALCYHGIDQYTCALRICLDPGTIIASCFHYWLLTVIKSFLTGAFVYAALTPGTSRPPKTTKLLGLYSPDLVQQHSMPAKYSHVKKRSASGLLKKSGQGTPYAVKDSPPTHNHGQHGHGHTFTHGHGHHKLNPLIDRSISQAMTAVAQLEPAISELERAIARILLIRYEHDIARLFSTRLYSLSLVQLPTFVMRCLSLGGPSWLAWNYNCDEIKDFFRALISMDMRQAGERVATKSVLWSYTALRQFVCGNLFHW